MGFNWYKGPFEMLEEIGVKKYIDRVEKISAVPDFLLQTLKSQDNPYSSKQSSYFHSSKGLTKIET